MSFVWIDPPVPSSFLQKGKKKERFNQSFLQGWSMALSAARTANQPNMNRAIELASEDGYKVGLNDGIQQGRVSAPPSEPRYSAPSHYSVPPRFSNYGSNYHGGSSPAPQNYGGVQDNEFGFGGRNLLGPSTVSYGGF